MGGNLHVFWECTHLYVNWGERFELYNGDGDVGTGKESEGTYHVFKFLGNPADELDNTLSGERNRWKFASNPLVLDTDQDLVPDGMECSPYEDTDGDGLINIKDRDSDNDGVIDGKENYDLLFKFNSIEYTLELKYNMDLSEETIESLLAEKIPTPIDISGFNLGIPESDTL
ncbi:MAG: hypothetical protein DRI61_16860, partial [Chloroflexi bacterium]